MIRKLRIFISSPGDVGQERLIASRVVERLQGEFAGYAELEPILWEHEPLRASSHFQEQIIPPSETDIVVCILWARLGTRLPDQFRREDGTNYASGTEWEFEDALKAYTARGTPDLMVYRKTAEPHASMSDEGALMQRLHQKKALDAFIGQWFGNPVDSFRAAFHTFDAPAAFEMLVENHLRQLIREKLPRQLEDDGDTTPIQWYKGSPFRGLEAFDTEHAPVFFGRTRAIADIKEALSHQATRNCAFLLVFGMSGCGKSSLVRAGVLPTITQPGVIEGIGVWRWGILRPSDAPDLFTGLASALLAETALPELVGIGYNAPELAALLREAPARAVAILQLGMKHVAEAVAREEGRPEPPNARLAVMVDQLEEIFTLDRIADDERTGFVTALATLARSKLVWVIATMRSDFYPRCIDIPELSELKEGEGQYDLRPADFTEIGQMIRYPARAAGLRFERRPDTGQRLDDLLLEAAIRDPEGLPLLEFTLDELFKLRADNGLLTFAAYEQLGGLDGALAQRAEEVFAALNPSAQAALPAVLRRLVTVGETGEDLVAARPVPLRELETVSERKSLLDAFVTARLLVTDRADDGEPIVRVAHEALLRHWPRLQEWLAEDKSFLHTRERTATSARRWREEERSHDFLLPEGKPLANALDMLAVRPQDLDADIVEYINASRLTVVVARRRKLRAAVGTAALFFIVVSSFALFSYIQWQRSESQKKLALDAVNELTYDVPRRLIEVPGSRPVLRDIFEQNLKLLNRIDNARALREKRVNYGYMGDMWLLFGDIPRASAAYAQSLKLAEVEAQDRGDVEAQKALATCRTHMGDALQQNGDYRAAMDYYTQSLLGLQALAATDRSNTTISNTIIHDISVAYEKIGDVRLAMKDVPSALDSYQHSLDLQLDRQQGRGDRPAQNVAGRQELAVIYLKQGDARSDSGDVTGALDSYRVALTLLERPADQPAGPDAQRYLLATLAKIGTACLSTRQTERAQQVYRRALALAQTLAQDRTNVRAQRDLMATYIGVSKLYLAQGDNTAALDACQQGLRIAQRLPQNSQNQLNGLNRSKRLNDQSALLSGPQEKQDNNDVLTRQNLRDLYEQLSLIRSLLNDQKGALEAHSQSLQVSLELIAKDLSQQARLQQADLLQQIGATRMALSDSKGGMTAYMQALDLYRGLATASSPQASGKP